MGEELREYKGHRVNIEGKRRVSISAVEDIDSFNENEIIFLTAAGMMTISGQDLHISKLSLDEGLLIIDGEVYSVEYADLEEERTQKSGFLSRVFK